jgi:hypothetical protein
MPDSGTGAVRHPWFVGRVEALLAAIPSLVLHRSVTRNYGLMGGYLECSFWTLADGSPIGLTVSSWRLER